MAVLFDAVSNIRQTLPLRFKVHMFCQFGFLLVATLYKYAVSAFGKVEFDVGRLDAFLWEVSDRPVLDPDNDPAYRNRVLYHAFEY